MPTQTQHAAQPSRSRRFDVVFCDVDGCLTPEAAGPADNDALAHIACHNARAVTDHDRPIVVPCTGRPQPFCEAICKVLGHLGGVPAICEHGAWRFWFEKNRWQLDPGITKDDLRAIREIETWVRDELGDEGCFLQLGKHAGATIFHDDVGFLTESIRPRAEALITERGWPIRVSMTWTCINLDLKHVSKGRAIDLVIEELGLDRARLAGIGDTLGDLAIRERVAWFGCPANASDEIKAHADHTAGSHEARGVVELLGLISS